MEQNRDPRNKPKSLWSINCWQRGSSIKWSKNSLFNKRCWENWTATCKKKKMKLKHQLTPYAKIYSRWIKDLNISCDTIKVLEENIGRKISGIPHSNIFTHMSPIGRDIKEKIKNGASWKWKPSVRLKKTSAQWKGKQLCGNIYLEMAPWTRVWSSKYIRNSHDYTPGR